MFGAKEFAKYRSKIVLLADITLAGGGATTGNTRTSNLESVRRFKEGTFFIRHTGFSAGTTKTLDVVIQSKDPAGAYYHTLTSFTQITDTSAGGEVKKVTANMGNEIALTWEKGSTDCAINFTVWAVVK